MAETIKAVVAWHNAEQIEKFLSAWGISRDDPRLHLQQDVKREGCARTKNKGIAAADSDIVVVLDDDCYPSGLGFADFLEAHRAALEPQPVENTFQVVTNPASRGTPYHCRSANMPVAASMGFWRGVGDYDACGQLVHGAATPMVWDRRTIFGKYFPLSGMNLALRPWMWGEWCQFIDVPRFDDIWMGWLFQKAAYAQGHCFNLSGPTVLHSRQSNVWQNLRDEAKHLEANETLWAKIAAGPLDYNDLTTLLPI
jgi:hypothetical protein